MAYMVIMQIAISYPKACCALFSFIFWSLELTTVGLLPECRKKQVQP